MYKTDSIKIGDSLIYFIRYNGCYRRVITDDEFKCRLSLGYFGGDIKESIEGRISKNLDGDILTLYQFINGKLIFINLAVKLLDSGVKTNYGALSDFGFSFSSGLCYVIEVVSNIGVDLVRTETGINCIPVPYYFLEWLLGSDHDEKRSAISDSILVRGSRLSSRQLTNFNMYFY